MKKPDISVILPFHNAERFIEKSLGSVLASNHGNIEIIAVDDGSSDGSLAVCEIIAECDSRVRLIHKDKGGVSAARNRGLDIAQGEYIAFADADDEVSPDMYRYLLRKAKEYSADIAQCAVIFDYGEHNEIRFSPNRELLCESKSKSLGKYLAYSCWSKIYRRELLGDLRFDESLTVGEDLYYNLEALSRCGKILFTTEAHYRYIQRSDSVMGGLVKSRRLDDFTKALHKAECDFPALKNFIRLAILRNFAHILSLTSGENDEYCKVLFAKTRKLARKNPFLVLFCRGLPARKRLGILFAVFMPGLYKYLIQRKPENE